MFSWVRAEKATREVISGSSSSSASESCPGGSGQIAEMGLDVADDAPGVGRQAVAHRVGGLPQGLEGLRETAQARRVRDQGKHLGDRVAQTLGRPGADEAGEGLGLIGQRLQQGAQATGVACRGG
jgi:hypothetical protein